MPRPTRLRVWLAGALLCLLALSATAAPVAVTTGPAGRDLAPHLELLEDPAGTLTLADVQAATGFRRVAPGGPKIGFSDSAWWVRVTLANPGDAPAEVVLRENYPLMDHLSLWAQDAGGQWRETRTGDRLPFASRPLAHRDFLFPLTVPARSERTVYLRFASDGPIDIALSLYAPPALIGTLSREQLAYGAYFGGFIVLVLYNFFMFLVVRDRAFFWYLLYASSYGLYFAVFNGLSFQFLWPGQPAWGNTSLLVLLGLTLVFGLQFTRRFLDTAVGAPRLDVVARALQALAAAAVAAAFVLPYSVLIQPVALLTVAVTATIIALGVLGLLRGYRPARYFMIAWALLLIGVLANMSKTFGLLPHNVFTQNGFQLGSLCEMVLLSLALAARVDEMKQLTRTDALTRLFNRRHFDERLAFEVERAQRFGTPLSLLIADIDHFKQFNDRHGHARGDAVLRAVSRHLRDGVRRQDIVCRYGGEEFALILPSPAGTQAAAIAEKLRTAVAADRHADTATTISIGVASLGEHGIGDGVALFHAADAAMYAAKAAGRDRVVRGPALETAVASGSV